MVLFLNILLQKLCAVLCVSFLDLWIHSVPDRRSRDHEVVVVWRTINLGTGNLEWGGVEERGGQFTSNLRPRWTGSYHSKEGFQVSKGE
jgi:hypothetical protein